jgi:hypothetical protein
VSAVVVAERLLLISVVQEEAVKSLSEKIPPPASPQMFVAE